MSQICGLTAFPSLDSPAPSQWWGREPHVVLARPGSWSRRCPPAAVGPFPGAPVSCSRRRSVFPAAAAPSAASALQEGFPPAPSLCSEHTLSSPLSVLHTPCVCISNGLRRLTHTWPSAVRIKLESCHLPSGGLSLPSELPLTKGFRLALSPQVSRAFETDVLSSFPHPKWKL